MVVLSLRQVLWMWKCLQALKRDILPCVDEIVRWRDRMTLHDSNRKIQYQTEAL